MGTQQRKIFLVFQSRFSIHRITNCMGKHASLRIASGLCSVCGYFCCGKYFAVCRYNIPTDHMIRKQILQGIIRTVDKIIALCIIKVDQIPDHADKDQHKKTGYQCIFPITGSSFFRNLLSLALLTLPELFAPLLFFDISQFLRPHLLSKYTIPE